MKEKVLYQYGHLFKPNAYNSEGIGTGVLSNLDQLDVAHKLAMAEIQKIQSNRNLTSQGKFSAFRALAEKTDESLAELDRTLAGYADQVQHLEEAVKPKRHPRDDIAYQLEMREIRDHIKSLDPLDQDAFILAALESGNLQIMEAVRYAPIPFKFASGEMIEKIQTRQQAIQHPDETARLADLRLANRETSSAISSVKAVLGQQGLVLRRQDVSVAVAA